ncbi:uncharacterized protein TRAVEDRAFT_49896 [Trametes versicolor FP-101664 SS1]|uniref:uncharacterized protein n=1 Tax=Trametes versicolor (strain FP-101664) TaxID=717944 RepID=UPI000462463C|nr:uncharacterized protein TRAVEDRAFT_49896 [Trametes versicolor FP-101664 SS1]EIW57086.1 hypothetical protein TRAVEDRAFT_49896 [Trametes versicolor FP-101664 SS1]
MRDFREIEKTMLPHKVDDLIQRNSNGNRIKLVINWPGHPSSTGHWINLTKRVDHKEEWLSRAELHLRVCQTYRQYFLDIRTSGVESTEPDWAVSSSRTDLRRLYVTALWFCGENIFHADVDYDVFFPGPA